MKNLRPPFKRGEPSPNREGKNGRDWMAHVRNFLRQKEPALMRDAQGRLVPRFDNVLGSIHMAALKGNWSQQEFLMRVMGVNVAAKTELTGPDGEPLQTAPVIFRMGDAGTLEDPEGGAAKPVKTDPGSEPPAPPPGAPDDPE